MTNPFRPHTTDDARAGEAPRPDDGTGMDGGAERLNPFQEELEEASTVDGAVPAGVPRNPFQKTAPASPGGSWKDARPARPASMASYRASRVLDVDSFKTLLMTGSVEPERAAKPPADSSSSTETSSLSRQSIAESKEPVLETPRSSYDASRDDEPLQRSQIQREKIKPPPPPRSRHGKALPPKGPQTVSFDDFSPTIPENLPPKPRATAPRLEADITSPTLPSPSPALPPPDNPSNPRKDADALSSQRKTVPPPPPLARRSTVTKRPRRNTGSSINSQPDDQPSYPPSIAESSTSQKMGPPLPPTRRMGSTTNIVSPTAVTSNPEPPAVPGRTRSTSQASLASAPPPPPPARRQSSRASLESVRGIGAELRRMSSEAARTSIDSQRRVSLNEETKRSAEHIGEQAAAPETQPNASASDILADMEAFQKEIDELRARMT